MESVMWDKIEHNGYEVWVLAGQSIRFEELVATFPSEEAAREAGYVEGKRRVDGIHEGALKRGYQAT
jgi:hypothetical protein